MHGPDHQRLGVLAAQQPHRRNVLHSDRLSVLAPHDVVGHDVGRRGHAQLVHRREAELSHCGSIGVHDPVLAVADRHRVAERADDRVKAPLAAEQRHAEFPNQPFVLALGCLARGEVDDERMKRPFPAVLEGRDRHLDRELGPIAPQRRRLDAAVENRSAAAGEEARKPPSARGAIPLGDDQIGHCPSECIGARDPEHRLRGRIPIGHQSHLIRRHDGGVRAVQNQLGERRGHPPQLSNALAGHPARTLDNPRSDVWTSIPGARQRRAVAFAATQEAGKQRTEGEDMDKNYGLEGQGHGASPPHQWRRRGGSAWQRRRSASKERADAGRFAERSGPRPGRAGPAGGCRRRLLGPAPRAAQGRGRTASRLPTTSSQRATPRSRRSSSASARSSAARVG